MSAPETVEFRLDVPPTAPIQLPTRPQRAVRRARGAYPPPVPAPADAATSLTMPALRLA